MICGLAHIIQRERNQQTLRPKNKTRSHGADNTKKKIPMHTHTQRLIQIRVDKVASIYHFISNCDLGTRQISSFCNPFARWRRPQPCWSLIASRSRTVKLSRAYINKRRFTLDPKSIITPNLWEASTVETHALWWPLVNFTIVNDDEKNVVV